MQLIDHIILSASSSGNLMDSFFTLKGIMSVILGVIIFYGFMNFWNKLGIKVLLLLLSLIFLYSPWGVVAYQGITKMINECFEMVSGLVTIPKWTIPFQTVLFFFTLLSFLYIGHNLFSRILNGITFWGYIILYIILYYLGSGQEVEIAYGITSSLKELLQCNLFASLFGNMEQMKLLPASGIKFIMIAIILALTAILILLCWKLARSYDWVRLKDDSGIQWYQVVLFMLLLIRPVLSLVMIGLLPFQYHAFRIDEKNSLYRSMEKNKISNKKKNAINAKAVDVPSSPHTVSSEVITEEVVPVKDINSSSIEGESV